MDFVTTFAVLCDGIIIIFLRCIDNNGCLARAVLHGITIFDLFVTL